ncbi:MAG: PilT/PilU family type 4a pilus ATPase [Candidatus Omnitrophica bacterium]|nr:PilT/PilU family type 4a pilus ATPase [Candidatus Omnitrophota bacterium]
MKTSLIELIRHAAGVGASDIHVGLNQNPKIRIHSHLLDAEGFAVVTPERMEAYLREVTPEPKLERFFKEKEMDYSFVVEGVGSCRSNLFFQRGNPGMAIRILPSRIWTFEELGLDAEMMRRMADRPTGLVLVTGATGSGKTTTLASLVEYVNTTRPCHIITVEDPVEFVFEGKKAKIDQREVGLDTHSFTGALKYILRQDPDVVLIGEMRDLETIETALNVAETGHLVFATLHTSDTIQTINRVIDVFPEHKQRQVRTQLSFVLNAVLSQRLVPSSCGTGRALCAEIMIVNSAIRSMIRDEKVHQIYSFLQTSKESGMKTMNQSLADLVLAKKVDLEEAVHFSNDPDEMIRLVEEAAPAEKKKGFMGRRS